MICQIGFGIFDYNYDMSKSKCPLCQLNITANTCLFSNCDYTFKGIKKDDQFSPPVRVNLQEMKEVDYKNWEYYDPKKSGKTTWISLKIITKKHNMNK